MLYILSSLIDVRGPLSLAAPSSARYQSPFLLPHFLSLSSFKMAASFLLDFDENNTAHGSTELLSGCKKVIPSFVLLL